MFEQEKAARGGSGGAGEGGRGKGKRSSPHDVMKRGCHRHRTKNKNHAVVTAMHAWNTSGSHRVRTKNKNHAVVTAMHAYGTPAVVTACCCLFFLTRSQQHDQVRITCETPVLRHPNHICVHQPLANDITTHCPCGCVGVVQDMYAWVPNDTERPIQSDASIDPNQVCIASANE